MVEWNLTNLGYLGEWAPANLCRNGSDKHKLASEERRFGRNVTNLGGKSRGIEQLLWEGLGEIKSYL
jgi:hypothetical protein